MTEQYVWFLLLALISEVIGTVSGFGSSILFVPIASLFFDFHTVLGITAVFHVFSNVSKIILFRKGIQASIVLKLGIPAVIFVVIGALLTNVIPTDVIELVMNGVLIVLALYLFVNYNATLQQSNRNLYLGGMTSGFLAGLIGTGGAIRGLTMAAFNLPKEVFIATSAFIDLGVDTSRAVVYIWNGYFETQYLVLIPALIIISIVGSYIGKFILHYTSERLFKKIVLIVIVCTALVQLLMYFKKL
jgi:uncharacterized membrane protein YfcA